MHLKKQYLFIFFGTAIFLSLLGFLYTRENLFRLASVEIENLSPELHNKIEKDLLPLYGRPMFSMSLSELREGIMRNPEVDSVRLMRIWPDRLRVEVKEKETTALEFADNNLYFLGPDGSRISPVTKPLSRPLLRNFLNVDQSTRAQILSWLQGEEDSEIQSNLEMGIWDLTTLTYLKKEGAISLIFSELDLEVTLLINRDLSKNWNRIVLAYHGLRARGLLAIRMGVGSSGRVFIYDSRELQKSESGINLKELVRRTRGEKPQVR